MQQRLRKISYSGIFIALIIAVGYTLAYVPNLELVTSMIFLSGYFLGIKNGLFIGILGEFLFSAFNPMGSGLIFPPMIIAQMISMAFVGIAGGFVGRYTSKTLFQKKYIIIFGVVGFIVTAFYDSLVSIAYPISAGFDFKQTLGLLMSGLIFSIMHMVTNLLIFTTILPVVCIRINKSGKFNE